MKMQWPFWVGLILAASGTLLVWQDVGSPGISKFLQGLGLALIVWNLLRMGGG